MGSLKFSQQYGNNKISVNQNQKVVTVPVGVVEPGDKHFIGVVQEITEEKFICSANELGDRIECIKGCNAEVGDKVIICLMQDGQYVVVARVGGDLGGGVLPEYGSTTDYIAGKVFAFAGNLVPAGCLLCDGSEVSRSEYWELFSVIGTLYGAGDGSTTFNLPNIESRTVIGESDNYTLGTTGGEETHKLTAEEAPEHWHSMSHILGAAGGVAGDGTILQKGYIGSQYSNIVEKENSWRYTTDVQGGNQPHNNMQPYIVMRYFITTGKADPASGINPADYVVEWGVTGIWEWRKWASGIAECWGEYVGTTAKTLGPWGSLYASDNAIPQQALPFTFAEVPTCSVTPKHGDSNVAGFLYTMGNATTTHTPAYGMARATPDSSMKPAVDFYVIGKWKDSPASGGTETIAPTIAEKFESIESDILDMKTNKVLWSGDSWPKADQTLTLSEAVSAQPNGIILVWCNNDYDNTGAATNYGWVFCPVPKSHVVKHNGKGIVCDGYNPTGNIHFIKYVYVSDTSIVGSPQNNVGNTDMNSGVIRNNQYATLRYVIGY